MPTHVPPLNPVACPYSTRWAEAEDPSDCATTITYNPATPFEFADTYPEFEKPAWFYIVYRSTDGNTVLTSNQVSLPVIERFYFLKNGAGQCY